MPGGAKTIPEIKLSKMVFLGADSLLQLSYDTALLQHALLMTIKSTSLWRILRMSGT